MIAPSRSQVVLHLGSNQCMDRGQGWNHAAVLHRFVSNASFHLWLESVFFRRLLLGLLREHPARAKWLHLHLHLGKDVRSNDKGENNLIQII